MLPKVRAIVTMAAIVLPVVSFSFAAGPAVLPTATDQEAYQRAVDRAIGFLQVKG